MTPRCGQPMRRRETPGHPVLEDPLCGRRAGHSGRHRSEAEMEARRRAASQAPSGSPVVAAVIRQAREAAGLSQRRLAAVLGVTETAVQNWEYAKRTPGDRSWVQLELTLGPLGVVRESAPETADEERSDAA